MQERSKLLDQLNGSDASSREPEARIILFVGSPPDSLGRNGDFAHDEEMNLFYGPKANGVWPEEPVAVPPGLRKNSWARATDIWAERQVQRPKKNFTWLLKAIVNFLLTGRTKPKYVYSVHHRNK